MNRTFLGIALAVLIAVAAYVVLFSNTEVALAPIVDEACPTGTERVGEGCISHQEACELQGDNFFYDISEKKCLPR